MTTEVPETLESFPIFIGGRWSLEDLSVFPRVYEQVYFGLEAMQSLIAGEPDEDMARVFQAYPWHGGYSAVGFFDRLKRQTPRGRRPQLRSMRYASPGVIELLLAVVIAERIAALVIRIAHAVSAIDKAYSEIIKNLMDRKLLRLKTESEELRLERDQLAYITECAARIAEILGIRDISALHRVTGSPYKSLKMLLALYRRVRQLVRFDEKGKVHFDQNRSQEPFDNDE